MFGNKYNVSNDNSVVASGLDSQGVVSQIENVPSTGDVLSYNSSGNLEWIPDSGSGLLSSNNTWTGTNTYTQPITTSKVTNNLDIEIESVTGEMNLNASNSIFLNPGSGAVGLLSANPRLIFGQTNPPIIRSTSSTDTSYIDIPRFPGPQTDEFITSITSQSIAGNKQFTNYCPSSLIAPTTADHLCNKSYVDSVAGGTKATMIARKTSENTINTTTLTTLSSYFTIALTTITQSYSVASSDLTISINSSGILTFNNTSGSAKDVRILLDFGFWTNATVPQNLLMRWSHNTGVSWRFLYASSVASIYQKEAFIQYYSIPVGTTNTQIQVQNNTNAGQTFSITSLQLSVDEL